MIRFFCSHPIQVKKVAFEAFKFLFERLLSYCPFVPIAVCGSWFVERLTFAIFLQAMPHFTYLNALFFHSNDWVRSTFRSIFQFPAAIIQTFVSIHCFLDPNCLNLFLKTHFSLILIELSYGTLVFVSPNSYDFVPNPNIVLQILEDISLIPHFPSVKGQHFANMMKSFALFNYHIFGLTFVTILFAFLKLHFIVLKRSNSTPIGCYLGWIDDSFFQSLVSK